ncbi:hypothetical protein JKP88DRAFT_350947 [Tribonema minus]|uniref:Uncharacterized protein n=1 Tax=Tribonema minus TaxID=303371 RepID=A0A835YK77_9STRA|nr:hypothetical protein JKP88DRAFT_350947 [Tribonema minus]
MSSVSVNASMLGKRSADADTVLDSDRGTSVRIKQAAAAAPGAPAAADDVANTYSLRERRYLMSSKEAEEAGIIVPRPFILPRIVDVAAAGIPIKAEFIATAMMRITAPPRRLISYQPTIAAATELAELAVKELERVHIFDDGINIPAVDGIFIDKTVGDDCLHMQWAGRCTRMYPGKKIATVLVWSAPEHMIDLCQDRPGWEQRLSVMAPSLEEADRSKERTAVAEAVAVIQRGIVAQ